MRTHGKRSTYVQGCRCTPCTEANRRGCMQWAQDVAAKTNLDDLPHGVRGTYSNYGCRCDLCAQAQSEYLRAYRQRKGTS